MDTANQLLAEYAHQGSERAFKELVEAHINLVYSAALREARGDVSLAEDITQAVFTELARRAASLVSHQAISGWLYTCVRRMTANVRRADERRQRREREACNMNELLKPDANEQLWQQMRPVLDDVMHELEQEDRTAVVLRYFEGRSLKEVGAALGLTENAARMRVERSLDKLQTLLGRRGIRSTTSTLGAALLAGAVVSAPSAMASSVAASAMASAAAGSAAGFTLAKLLAAAKSKTAIVAGLAILAGAIFIFQSSRNHTAAELTSKGNAVPPTAPSVTNDAGGNAAPAGAPPATNSISSSQMALQLLDAESSEPLAGAKLHLFYMFNDGRGKVIHAVTDTNGKLGVDKPQPPYRALNMFVTANGHVPKVTSFGFRRDMPSEYTMKLERGVLIGGTVVDEAGQPVSGAKITFDNAGNNPTLAENIQFGPDTTKRTDAKGNWSSDMIPKEYEAVSVGVSHPDYAEASLSVRPAGPDATKLVIKLPAGFAISGVVEDTNGTPVEGAAVRQVRMNRENERSRTSDNSGAFEFKGMGAGELCLAVQAKGFAPAVQTLQVTGSMTDVKFQLGPGQLLLGRITDENGNGISNAFVETTRRAIDKIRWSTNTDAEGRFTWDSAPTEPLLFSVLAEGYNQAYAESLKADGREHGIKLTRYQPTRDMFQVTGSVMDADSGQPLEAFKVYLSELDTNSAFPLQFYTTGKDGKFTISLPAKSYHPGYQIQIEQDGFLPAASAKLLHKDGSQTLEFKLHKGAGPSGVVLLSDGSPAANATVLLCTPLAGVTLGRSAQVEAGLNTTTYRAQADNSGRFSVPPAMDPQGVIVVHDQGYAEMSVAEVAAGRNIVLQPWGRVEGRLILDSQPAANEHIVAFNQVLRYTDTGREFGFLTYRFEASTDAEGKFSFDKVPPGRCKIFRQQQVANTFSSSHGTPITVRAGEVTQVTLGGAGRPVIGKASLAETAAPVDWTKVLVSLTSKSDEEPGSRPKREDFPSIQAYVAATEKFFQAVHAQRRFGGFCGNDGSFRVSDVSAGTYEVKIEMHDFKQNSVTPHEAPDPSPVIASLVREVVVPEGRGSEAIDLGVLELGPTPSSASAH